jgi:hypothetical protein
MSLRCRQAGAETVEFAVTLLIFFTVFMLIIDMAIAMYNKGAITNAARDGARQGSLFWMDPSAFNEADSSANLKLKESMISSAVNYWAGTVINPGADAVGHVTSLNGTAVVANSIQPAVAGGQVAVTVSYPHDYIGITGLLGVLGMNLQAGAGHEVEAR